MLITTSNSELVCFLKYVWTWPVFFCLLSLYVYNVSSEPPVILRLKSKSSWFGVLLPVERSMFFLFKLALQTFTLIIISSTQFSYLLFTAESSRIIGHHHTAASPTLFKSLLITWIPQGLAAYTKVGVITCSGVRKSCHYSPVLAWLNLEVQSQVNLPLILYNKQIEAPPSTQREKREKH